MTRIASFSKTRRHCAIRALFGLAVGLAIFAPMAPAQDTVSVAGATQNGALPMSSSLPGWFIPPPTYGTWACNGCVGVAGPMVINGGAVYYDTMWDLTWPSQESNHRPLVVWGGCNVSAVVGVARQPNSQYLYTLHTNGAGCGYGGPASDYHINQVVAATGAISLGPQLMLSASTPLTFSEGDIAVDPSNTRLYGITNTGLLFWVSLPLAPSACTNSMQGCVVVNQLGTVPGSGSNFTALSFDSSGTLYALDSGNSTIHQLAGHTAQIANSYHFTNPSLYGSAASMSFFGQPFPDVYVITGGRMKHVNLAAGTITDVGASDLDRGVAGTLVYTPTLSIM